MATCCFRSNMRLRVPVGGGEAGAIESLPRDEWLRAPADDLNALLRAAELQGDPKTAASATHTVNALRAAAAETHWAERWPGGLPISVELRTFEARFSPRNFCIVGRPTRPEPSDSQ